MVKDIRPPTERLSQRSEELGPDRRTLARHDSTLLELTAQLIESRAPHQDPLQDDLERELPLRTERVKSYIEGNCVLITGAAGSVGKALTAAVADLGATKLFLVDKDRAVTQPQPLWQRQNLDAVAEEIDLSDETAVAKFFTAYGSEIDVVFHLAAERNVHTCELYPVEAYLDNVVALQNVLVQTEQHNIQRLVYSSSRKATIYFPENVLGLTKRLGEVLVRSVATGSTTRYSTVRYIAIIENSVVLSIFKDHAERAQALPVTDCDISHVFQNMNEAVHLTLNAALHGGGGELFGARNLGWSKQILDLALHTIVKSKNRLPVVITGLREGDNHYEYGMIDLDDSETPIFNSLECQRLTSHGVYVESNGYQPPKGFEERLKVISRLAQDKRVTSEEFVDHLRDLVTNVVDYNVLLANADTLRRIRSINRLNPDSGISTLVDKTLGSQCDGVSRCEYTTTVQLSSPRQGST